MLVHRIAYLVRVRRENPALHRDWSLTFHDTDNVQLLAYSKREGANRLLVVVNLDPVSGTNSLEGDFTLRGADRVYRVRGGDSLWEIAKRHGTSVARLKQVNGMSSSHLKPGQVLEIPTRSR